MKIICKPCGFEIGLDRESVPYLFCPYCASPNLEYRDDRTNKKISLARQVTELRIQQKKELDGTRLKLPPLSLRQKGVRQH